MFVDCHIHMVLDGADWKSAIARHAQAADEGWIRQTLARYQKLGFTYLRDGGDRWGVGKRAREMAGEYGILYRTPLSPLCKLGHYGGFIGEKFENLLEYEKLVRKNKNNGADFIKIMISGLMDFDRFGVLTEEGLEPMEIRELILQLLSGDEIYLLRQLRRRKTFLKKADFIGYRCGAVLGNSFTERCVILVCNIVGGNSR